MTRSEIFLPDRWSIPICEPTAHGERPQENHSQKRRPYEEHALEKFLTISWMFMGCYGRHSGQNI